MSRPGRVRGCGNARYRTAQCGTNAHPASPPLPRGAQKLSRDPTGGECTRGETRVLFSTGGAY